MFYSTEKIILAIGLMSAVTYLPRFLPLLFLSGRKMSPALRIWLSYVPVAVLAALLGPALFYNRRKADPTSFFKYLFLGSPSLFCRALVTRNMFFTVLAGMASAALLRIML